MRVRVRVCVCVCVSSQTTVQLYTDMSGVIIKRGLALEPWSVGLLLVAAQGLCRQQALI